MSKGFDTKTTAPKNKKNLNFTRAPKTRLISWSPWPPADFQTRFPAFPFVLTILIIAVLQCYISLLRS